MTAEKPFDVYKNACLYNTDNKHMSTIIKYTYFEKLF